MISLMLSATKFWQVSAANHENRPNQQHAKESHVRDERLESFRDSGLSAIQAVLDGGQKAIRMVITLGTTKLRKWEKVVLPM